MRTEDKLLLTLVLFSVVAALYAIGVPLPLLALYAANALQLVLIAWTYRHTRAKAEDHPTWDLYRALRRDFVGANLVGVDLSSADLRNADLTGAILTDDQRTYAKSLGAIVDE